MRADPFVAAAILIAGWVTAAPARQVAQEMPEKPHQVSSTVCKTCHEEIYRQWEGSMHGQSTALQDPIHGAFYRFVIGDPKKEGVKTKKGTYPVCLKCHAPAAAMDGKTDLTALSAYGEGVNCITCHTMKTYKGLQGPDGRLRYGVDAYVFSETALQAPSGRDYTIHPSGVKPARPFHPFPMEGNTLLRTSAACMGCHDQRVNFKGAPLCVTGKEYAKFGTFIACQSCHMPKVGGLTDHSMVGGHGNMIESGLVMNATVERAGDKLLLSVNLHNQLPHGYPTGAPFRNFYLRVTGYDENGDVRWRNFEKHPMKEDPRSMFVMVLGDENNKPAPPPKATQVLKDTRMEPNERRVVEYEIPAEGIRYVRVEALYNLVLPPQIEMLDRMSREIPDLPPLTEGLLDPKPVVFAELEIPTTETGR
jgi:hypothetical protein